MMSTAVAHGRLTIVVVLALIALLLSQCMSIKNYEYLSFEGVKEAKVIQWSNHAASHGRCEAPRRVVRGRRGLAGRSSQAIAP